MQLFTQMLVAVDASGTSVTEAKALLGLPRVGQTVVTLLHVVPTAQVSAGMMADAKTTEGETLLEEAESALSTYSDVKVVTRLEKGDAKTILLKVADEIDASLIVMGGRSMNRLVAILKNSVSQYVFQLSTRPLLIVREGILPSTKIYRVMAALDGSSASDMALNIALDMVANTSGSQLLLARVISGRSAASYQKTADNPETDDEVLAKAIQAAKSRRVDYRAYYNIGDPGREISLLSGESGADLLVMGSPDRRPTIAKNLPDLERLLGSSVSDYVRVHAQCPVLMTRTEG